VGSVLGLLGGAAVARLMAANGGRGPSEVQCRSVMAAGRVSGAILHRDWLRPMKGRKDVGSDSALGHVEPGL
jgi:hypothetical protein